jgi:hypothetical protein
LKDILLLTAPFTQLNTPYPATAYLKGFFNTKGISAFQADLGIEVILELLSQKQLKKIFALASAEERIQSENAARIYALRENYLKVIDQVIGFLQGENQTLARQICTDNFLPKASRFDQLDDMDWAFGLMGNQDKAKHLATLFLEDLSDFIVECIDENFGFSRYAERLGRSANSFDELHLALSQPLTFIDKITLKILEEKMEIAKPKMVCISIPFPGNLYSSFRCAQQIKKNYPGVVISMGGGFPNTELRSISDPRVFEFFDYITLDDGETPLEVLHSNVVSPSGDNPHFGKLKRTFFRENGTVVYDNSSIQPDYKQAQVGTPDYSDLRLDSYISVIEIANPMHSLWSDGRWNKLTMAHGCYWGKCTFCDISLDYIKVYEPATAMLLADRVEELIEKTGERGFHFVDEAAPPALMKAFALEIIKRDITITWWANIRFEKSFTSDLCMLLKSSGCVAISGGLEVASDRLLKLIDKGVTVEQVARVTHDFTEAGIMVHAYLMYGYPTQTTQETIDSLEMVRQMFELGTMQSGFWHQFALTAHSPVGLNPEEFGVTPQLKEITFANNDIEFKDKTGIDHGKFSFGLKKSLFNYMHGICFDFPLDEWFEFKVPKTKVEPHFIQDSLEAVDEDFSVKANGKVYWLGGEPEIFEKTKTKRGDTWSLMELVFHDNVGTFEITLDLDHGQWLVEMLPKLSPKNEKSFSFSELKTHFEGGFEDFELFWFSKPVGVLRESGLILV